MLTVSYGTSVLQPWVRMSLQQSTITVRSCICKYNPVVVVVSSAYCALKRCFHSPVNAGKGGCSEWWSLDQFHLVSCGNLPNVLQRFFGRMYSCVKVEKGYMAVDGLRAVEHCLWYGIIQCWLSPDTGECILASTTQGWKAELTWVVGYILMGGLWANMLTDMKEYFGSGLQKFPSP